jgi:hypothetical protein
MARTTTSALQVLPPSTNNEQSGGTPTNRGRLLTAAQVAAELFSGTVSAAWVRRNVPLKLVLGHSTVRWFEYDVQAWLTNQRSETSTCAPVSIGV